MAQQRIAAMTSRHKDACAHACSTTHVQQHEGTALPRRSIGPAQPHRYEMSHGTDKHVYTRRRKTIHTSIQMHKDIRTLTAWPGRAAEILTRPAKTFQDAVTCTTSHHGAHACKHQAADKASPGKGCFL
eukprot:4933297-Alexandrium_andersonii.AAC.1